MNAITTYRFEKVEVKAVFRWKENGKPRQKTKTFWQTISPFNKDKDGYIKRREDIWPELYKERDEWLWEMKRKHKNTEAPKAEPVKAKQRPIKVVKRDSGVE